VFLALEAGVHRFQGTGEKENQPLLTVRPVAMRSHLSEKELGMPAIGPPAAPALKQLRLMPAIRDHLHSGGLELCGGILLEQRVQNYFQDLELILLAHLDVAERSGGLDREALFSFELDQVKEAKR
jgi:ATP-dependent Clp protease ATP-binding subunit ClpC